MIDIGDVKFIAREWEKVIHEELGIKIHYTIEISNISEGSYCFEDSITISKTKLKQLKWSSVGAENGHSGGWNKLTESPLHHVILHEMCHVIDNTLGPIGKFDQIRQLSSLDEWLKIDRKTQRDSYGSSAPDEDLIASLMYYMLGAKNKLTKLRIEFIETFIKYPEKIKSLNESGKIYDWKKALIIFEKLFNKEPAVMSGDCWSIAAINYFELKKQNYDYVEIVGVNGPHVLAYCDDLGFIDGEGFHDEGEFSGHRYYKTFNGFLKFLKSENSWADEDQLDDVMKIAQFYQK